MTDEDNRMTIEVEQWLRDNPPRSKDADRIEALTLENQELRSENARLREECEAQYREGRASERAAIVAWMRTYPSGFDDVSDHVIDCIEEGIHMKASEVAA